MTTFSICLVNMPFASIHVPSFALTQWEAVVKEAFGERVSVEVCYVNHDFALYMGVNLYDYLSLVPKGTLIGEHFFRQIAFPELDDNVDAFFQRFYPRQDELKHLIREKRCGAEDFLARMIDQYGIDQASIVGFTSAYIQNAQTVACLAMARQLKERNPDVVTVMGGGNCEAPMGDAIVKHVPQIDFVFSNPSLRSFRQFVGYCLDRDVDRGHRIDGVFSKQNRVRRSSETVSEEPAGEGSPLSVGPIGQDLDINTRIDLDYDPFLDSHEEHFPDGQVTKILLYETSRGCWWGERSKCTFCGMNGLNAHYRAMSPERAIEQFETLFERYASRCSYFWAVDHIMPREYPQQVFAHLDMPPNVVITCYMKTGVTDGDMEALSRAGVKGFQPGLESLNTSMLKLMNKGATAFSNLRFLKQCMTYDIYPVWNMLLGLPGQAKEDADAAYQKMVSDIPSLVHLPPPFATFPIRIDRYSHYFDNAERYGLDLRPYEVPRMIYPFDDDVLSDVVYCFVDDGNYTAAYFKPVLKWVDRIRDGIDRWWLRWHGQEGSVPPKLFIHEHGRSTVVYDSRSGEVVEHQVGEVGRRVLEDLTRPRRLSDLAADWGHLPGFDPQEEVAFLQERGLLFQEGDRYMSLVFSEEPPPQPRLSKGDPRLDVLFTLFPRGLLKSMGEQQPWRVGLRLNA